METQNNDTLRQVVTRHLQTLSTSAAASASSWAELVLGDDIGLTYLEIGRSWKNFVLWSNKHHDAASHNLLLTVVQLFDGYGDGMPWDKAYESELPLAFMIKHASFDLIEIRFSATADSSSFTKACQFTFIHLYLSKFLWRLRNARPQIAPHVLFALLAHVKSAAGFSYLYKENIALLLEFLPHMNVLLPWATHALKVNPNDFDVLTPLCTFKQLWNIAEINKAGCVHHWQEFFSVVKQIKLKRYAPRLCAIQQSLQSVDPSMKLDQIALCIADFDQGHESIYERYTDFHGECIQQLQCKEITSEAKDEKFTVFFVTRADGNEEHVFHLLHELVHSKPARVQKRVISDTRVEFEILEDDSSSKGVLEEEEPPAKRSRTS